jgi:hypothetical protein
MSVEALAQRYRDGEITGELLGSMVTAGELSKGDRRKIVKLATKLPESTELSERQKLRLITKQKKSLPKMSKDDRVKKYVTGVIETEREKAKEKFAVCLGCRKKGHILKNCPEAKKEVGICFNCGSIEHALRACPLPRSNTLKFAKCFVCNQSGHISKDCPENANGLYPKGGCCHICLQKTHLVKDCPDRTEEDAENHRKRKMKEEDDRLGPRIGETEGDGDAALGGDYYDVSFGKTTGGQDDEGDGDDGEGSGGKTAKEVWHPGMKKRKKPRK